MLPVLTDGGDIAEVSVIASGGVAIAAADDACRLHLIDLHRGFQIFFFLTSAMHHPKTLIGQELLHQTIVNYKKFFSNKNYQSITF